jgi:hypothetical protein
MALGLTQPVIGINSWDLSFMCSVSGNSRSINLLDSSGFVQACTGIALASKLLLELCVHLCFCFVMLVLQMCKH